jgi:peptidoglycan/LPS O-acetylase OafA/YrhL
MKNEIRGLTGFRGIAALLVAVYHFTKAHGPDGAIYLHGGYLAVDAFFVLSGYVLAYNYASTFLNGFEWSGYREFLIKRICRVYPAYIVILVLAFAKLAFDFSGSGGLVDFGMWDAFCNVFMLTGWGLHAHSIMGVSWSVSAELFCYIFFPVFVMFNKLRIVPLVASSVAIFILIAVISRVGGGVVGPLDIVAEDTFFPLLRAACGFAIGVILFAVANRIPAFESRVIDSALAVSVILLIAVWAYDESDLIKYVVIACMVLLIAQDTWLSKALFGNAIVYFVGEVSYSLYLIHPLLVSGTVKITRTLAPVLGQQVAFAGGIALYLSVALAASAVSYMLLELRGKKLMLGLLLQPQKKAA